MVYSLSILFHWGGWLQRCYYLGYYISKHCFIQNWFMFVFIQCCALKLKSLCLAVGQLISILSKIIVKKIKMKGAMIFFFEWNFVLWGSDKMQLCKMTTRLLICNLISCVGLVTLFANFIHSGKFSSSQNWHLVELKWAHFNFLLYFSHFLI